MNRTLWSWLILLISIGFALGVLVPKIQSVRTITLDKEAKLQMVTNKQARLAALQELQTLFASQQDRVKNLISTLPQTPEVPEVLVTIEALANQSGVAVQSMLPQINNREHQIDLTLVGDAELTNLEAFMQGISDNARPMSVTAFTAVKNQSNSTRLAYNLVVTLPYTVAAKSTTSSTTEGAQP